MNANPTLRSRQARRLVTRVALPWMVGLVILLELFVTASWPVTVVVLGATATLGAMG
jgi:hypothetical protein